MSFLAKVGYMFGYVPGDDSAAQNRCFEYLELAERRMEHDIDTMPDEWVEPGAPTGEDAKSMLKNRLRLLKDVTDLVSNSEGKRGWRYARNFWNYWDKVKMSAIEYLEGEGADVKQKINELEQGRYSPHA
jgi:hypothetical protein